MLLQAWSVLTLGRVHDRRYVYPLEHVVPQDPSDLYFEAGVQSVVMKDSPAKVMRAEGFGVTMDFYTVSQRAANYRRLREKRERAKMVAAARAEAESAEEEQAEPESAPQ